MSTEPTGKVVTFYSFKGGTGRTMALANIAWILAANGKRVLVVDWDLESPGLHRYYSPFLRKADVTESTGVIGMVHAFQNAWMRYLSEGKRSPVPDITAHADPASHIVPVEWEHFKDGGRLDLLPAGTLNTDYTTARTGLNWDDFYEGTNGGAFFDALRATMRNRYDYALIDSRTGLSDIAAICTVQMPDVLVDCFTLNEQGIEGAAAVARQVDGHRHGIRILPVPMRLDPAEKAKSDATRAFAKQSFEGFPAAADQDARDAYWDRIFVPYQAFYNYEERLAAFGDVAGSRDIMLAAYETLTAELTGGEVTALPRIDPDDRMRINDRYERRLTVAEKSVTLRYAQGDRIWAEWLTDVLNRAGIRVADAAADTSPTVSGHRDLLIVSERSEANPDLRLSSASLIRPNALAVCLTDSAQTALLADRRATFLTGLDEAGSVDAVLRLVGRPEGLPSGARGSGVRFPAQEPSVANLEPRNQRFTGREADLVSVREHLMTGGAVALQGMGGIGKSQIALEYAHRFRTSYDVVWWIGADPIAFIDTQLVDLGKRLGLAFPETGAAIQNAQTVVEALGRGTPYRRWLLIFDNAEEAEKIQQFLPRETGHILITARTTAWTERMAVPSITVDVFARTESIELLLGRLSSISAREADDLAEALGDLPIAVNAAAAFLAETKFSVEYLLDAIGRTGPDALPIPFDEQGDDEPRIRPVQAIWDASIARLLTRSPAAYRLLQLCSLMDTSVALDFVYSDELTETLLPFNAGLRERMLRGRLVQDLSRLALARTDGQGSGGRAGGRITVHRLIQHMVRSRMTHDELNETRHQVHLALARFRPGGEVDNPETWPVFRMIWPHLERADAVSCPDEAVRQLLIDRVRYLWLVGDFQRGRDRAAQTEKVWRARLAELIATGQEGGDDEQDLRRQLLHLRVNLANVIRSLGEFTESLAIDQEVLAEQRAGLGEDHPLTLATAGGLGGDLRGLGHYQQALEQDQRTYDLWLEAFGEDHPRTLASLNNLATSYRLMGDYRKALELDERVLRGREVILGKRHPNTLLSMGHLGRDLREAGEYQRSVTLLRLVAQAFTEEISADARHTLNANVNLAISMRSSGRVEEAQRLFDHAYGHLSETFPTAPDTLACRLSRAVTLLGVANQQAHEELRVVHASFHQRYGPEHPHTLVAMNDLAMALLTGEEKEEAYDLTRQAALDFGRFLGIDHPYTLAAETNYGVCLAEQGRGQEALALLTDTAQRAAETLGESHPDTLTCHANIALITERAVGSGNASAAIGDRLAQKAGSAHPTVAAIEARQLVKRVIDPLPF
ncbi:FxSxx-COOH system tetratricopeptide repeat protein [Actinoplanes sp. NPDC051851]|uniref:FxSxx-COOH system tetratricopeptide repeat protein n=1 Tax=Actinoplanes sp. NPDC051851 TaxID=3154753 RepID=UPI0034216F63